MKYLQSARATQLARTTIYVVVVSSGDSWWPLGRGRGGRARMGRGGEPQGRGVVVNVAVSFAHYLCERLICQSSFCCFLLFTI